METPTDIKDIQYTSKKRKKRKFGKSPIKQALEFFVKNIRYFAAGVIFVLMVVVIAFFMDKDENRPTIQYSEDGVELYEVDAYPAVMELVEQYYSCYSAGDFKTLQTLATPFSEDELAYMEMLSQYVEGYQNLVFYTKSGLDLNSYIVDVYLEMKFKGVETLAPGVASFYVRTNEAGTFYIDNSYSEYNMKYNDNPLDVNIHNLLKEHEQNEDVIALLSDTTAKYNAAIATDANLKTMLNETIPAAMSAWMAELVSGLPAPEPETEVTDTETESTEQETETETETEIDPDVITFPEGTIITITEATNVREEMTTQSDIVETIYRGERVTVIKSYAEGWTKVEWREKTGYIRSDLLQ